MKRTLETKEERRKRKRLKRERKAARAAKRAEKALAGQTAKEKKDRLDRKAQKHRDEETRSEDALSPFPKEVCKQARKSVARSPGDGLEPERCMLKRLGEEPASTNNGQPEDTSSHRLPRSVVATDAPNVVLTTKKKKKRKDTP